MNSILVGSTGFVGSNLAAQYPFELSCHSSDIEKAYGTAPELLVYAGIPSEMFLANHNPAADHARILQAEENIRRIAPKRIVLISTVAVYASANGGDEDTVSGEAELPAYGRHRRELEDWTERNIPAHLIVRLPAIYGLHMKKNFLYDMLHRIPWLLKAEKLRELAEREPLIGASYYDRGDGFLSCRDLQPAEKAELEAAFDRVGFSALNFTDSRSVYQFYPLSRLRQDLGRAMEADIRRLNLVTPPVSAGELYRELTGGPFHNEVMAHPYYYDLRTKHSTLFGRTDGYVMSREEEIRQVRLFLESMKEMSTK